MKQKITDELKQKVEKVCDEYLQEISDTYDEELEDDGGFFDSENFYDWDEDQFIINFFSISQDDFFFLDDEGVFIEVADNLHKKLLKVVSMVECSLSDDCPIISFEIL